MTSAVPASRSIRYQRAGNVDTARLAARREWLLANRSQIATSPDATKADMRKRARELHAIEAVLVARGELEATDAVFPGPVSFVPEGDWYAARRQTPGSVN